MQDQATTLVIPGQAGAPDPGVIDGPLGGALSQVFADPGTAAAWLLPVVVGLVVAMGLWAATNGRRRRRVDPRELAFRRVAHAQGWSRSQVRAIRRAAAAQGLASPVGLALSPALTGRVLAGSARAPRETQA